MADWIPTGKFEKTEYGKLNKLLDGKNYLGKYDLEKMPSGSRIVKDPKDGNFGIIVNENGAPMGKVDL